MDGAASRHGAGVQGAWRRRSCCLWLAAGDPCLTTAARESCRTPENDVFLGALSAWEIAIKHRLGRLPLPEPPSRYSLSSFSATQFCAGQYCLIKSS